MTTTRKPQHPKELQIEAVNLALELDNISDAARKLDIPMQTLHNWVKAHNKGMLKSTESYNPEIAKLLEENKQLKSALKIAEMEREILKKATLRSSAPHLPRKASEVRLYEAT